MKGNAPRAWSHTRREPRQHGGAGENRVLYRWPIGETRAKAVVERDQDLRGTLLGYDVIVRRSIVGRVLVEPSLDVARSPLAGADVEPIVGVDLVVDHEVGDSTVTVTAVITPGEHAGEAAVIGGHVRCAENLVAGADRRADPLGPCPGWDSVDHSGHHQTARRPVDDGTVDILV